ncbi:MAG: carboxypeptidase-like regulatory domain-containing protein, partial [Sphingobacteriales bacterium]
MLKDKLKRLILPFVLIAFIPAYSEANDRANIPAPEWHGAVEKLITGKITQQGGQPLAGATITAKSSGASTTSDANGNFSINVKDDNDILVISFVGFATREVPASQSANIVLVSATNDLTNVVVVGYGSQNKRDVTGAVKSVKAESFNKGIILGPEQLIQGKVAGVNVTSASGEPGGAQSITVRGPGGVRTGSTPLFVIDGLPLDNSSTGGGNPLN